MMRTILAIALVLSLVACKDERDQTMERQTSVIAEQSKAITDQSRRQLEATAEQNKFLSGILERQSQQLAQADTERRLAQERLLGIERTLGAQGRSGGTGSDMGSVTIIVIFGLSALAIGALGVLFVRERRRQQPNSITITIPVGASQADVVEAVATAVRIEDSPRMTSRRGKQVRTAPSKRALIGPH